MSTTTTTTTTTPHPIITFDYQFAPNAQKARNLLHASSLPYRICAQPFVHPRPTLQSLGITYRRIPLISIGKDIFIDNRAFIDAVQELYPEQSPQTSKHDHAYEAFGYRCFWVVLAALPVEFLTADLIKERSDLFSVFGKSDYAVLRGSALAELLCFLRMIEDDFLGDATDEAPFINAGEKYGLVDVHAVWIPKFALETLGYSRTEPGFSRGDLPRVHRWIEMFPAHTPENEEKIEKIGAEEAKRVVLGGAYAVEEIGVDEGDPTGLRRGERVCVQTSDDNAPENARQFGRLVGLGGRRIVVELENGVRLHYPRVGYAVLRAE